MSSTPESKGSPWPWRWTENGLFDADGVQVIDNHYDPTEADQIIIAKAPEMAALLRELEWADHGEPYTSCSVCGAAKEDGQHAPDCRLSVLLRSLP